MVLVLTDWMEGSEVQGVFVLFKFFFFGFFSLLFFLGGVADLRVIGTWK